MSDRNAAVREVYRSLRIAEQLAYYRNLADEYTRANEQAILVRNTLLSVAAVAGAAGQFTGGNGRVAAGVTAAALAAIAGAVTAWETLVGFAPMAKLYDDAALSLEAEPGRGVPALGRRGRPGCRRRTGRAGLPRRGRTVGPADRPARPPGHDARAQHLTTGRHRWPGGQP